MFPLHLADDWLCLSSSQNFPSLVVSLFFLHGYWLITILLKEYQGQMFRLYKSIIPQQSFSLSSVANSYSDICKTWWSFCYFMKEFCLAWSYIGSAFCHDLCEFIFSTIILCLENTFTAIIHGLWLLQFLHPFFHNYPWDLEGSNVI